MRKFQDVQRPAGSILCIKKVPSLFIDPTGGSNSLMAESNCNPSRTVTAKGVGREAQIIAEAGRKGRYHSLEKWQAVAQT